MWGDSDPLWGVATWKGKNKGGDNPWTDEEFYELGRSDWQDFVEHWGRYGVDNTTCLEIGCGAGRLTKHMADYFGELHAIDVSEGMIEYARKRITSPRVHFHVVNGNSIPLPDRTVTAVFSTHVFQYFDTLDDATAYFREIARALVPNGTMMIHLPVFSWPHGMGNLPRQLYEVRRKLSALVANLKRWRINQGRFVPLMRGQSYPVGYFYSLFPTLGLRDIEVCTFVTKSNDSPHSFVFARKGNLIGVEKDLRAISEFSEKI